MITKGVKSLIVLFIVIISAVFGFWLLIQKLVSQDQQPVQSAQDQSAPIGQTIPQPRTGVS